MVNNPFGEVPELADGHDLGSCAVRRRGSSPRFPIQDLAQAKLSLPVSQGSLLTAIYESG